MADQPTPSGPHSQNLKNAVEITSAVINGYIPDPEAPDGSLATYITEQLVIAPDTIPEAVWGLIGGFANLAHLLLSKIEELDPNRTKEIQLDSYAYAADQNPDL